MAKLFGTNGIRGLTNEVITPELALEVGKAIGTFFGKGKKALLGKDVRYGGDMLINAVSSGLMSTGIRVYITDPAPTPAIEYAVRSLDYDFGVIITASHNPKEYNGIKIVKKDGGEQSRDDEKVIEEIIERKSYYNAKYNEIYNASRENRVIDTYISSIISIVDAEKIRSKAYKVIVDGANSVGSLTSPLIAAALGCKVISINTHLDPNFPGREPEPNDKTLVNTAKALEINNADIAVAHDGDADRAVFIDNKGVIHSGDESGALLAYHLKKKLKDNRAVITTVASSLAVLRFLKSNGIEYQMTRVGGIDMEDIVRGNKNKFYAYFEESSGFAYVDSHLTKDGGRALALMLELMASEGLSSSELFSKIEKTYKYKYKIPLDKIGSIEDNIIKIEKSFSSYSITKIDGVRVDSDSFMILFRKSGTEPIARLFIESRDKDELEKLKERIEEIIDVDLDSLAK
ncbi:MAG: phosphoglucomutase/phosphomannomutase [Candidatus Micrarchaeota archaeon]|nr:MAG: phosphoglucomutase/phosphomannomutase [Candidatus Micrarchaeota archaeon]